MTREMGGYFGLDIGNAKLYHHSAIALNSGRSCLAYLLAKENVTRLYLPNYLCDTLITTVAECGINYDFYPIDTRLEMLHQIKLNPDDRLLYVNYFGLKDEYAGKLPSKYGKALIVDNSQAFFSPPLADIDTFYSPRKFFGVPDGGYLYSNKRIDGDLATAHSSAHALHLLGRIDDGAEAWYQAYLEAEVALATQGIMRMSRLTHGLLGTIDYAAACERRNRNYDMLHQMLAELNRLEIAATRGAGPMVYPLLWDGERLRERLIKERIYVATYWREVVTREGSNDTERRLAEKCIALPIDQRYEITDMQRMARIILEVADE